MSGGKGGSQAQPPAAQGNSASIDSKVDDLINKFHSDLCNVNKNTDKYLANFVSFDNECNGATQEGSMAMLVSELFRVRKDTGHTPKKLLCCVLAMHYYGGGVLNAPTVPCSVRACLGSGSSLPLGHALFLFVITWAVAQVQVIVLAFSTVKKGCFKVH